MRIWQAFAQTPAQVTLAIYSTPEGDVADILAGARSDEPDRTRPRPVELRSVPIDEARALSSAVLVEPGPHAANRFIANWVEERTADLPGVRNEGLFSRHALVTYARDRDDWEDAVQLGKEAQRWVGRDLVASLGFTIDDSMIPGAAVLSAKGASRAVALFLEGPGSFDEPTLSLGAQSPVTHALALARRLNIPWIVLTRGASVRVHPVSPDVGVGRRGRASTFVELNVRLLPEQRAGYLWLIFSADALAENGTAEQLLDASGRYALALGTRLRERIFNEVVPRLAELIARDLAGVAIDAAALSSAYRQTMLLLFRLLFVSYAEDRGLLPYGRNERYTERSLKRLARHLHDLSEDSVQLDSRATDIWSDLRWAWHTVAEGNTEAGVPTYDGGLFSAETGDGQTLEVASFTNAEIGPILLDLLIDVDEDGLSGPVDFRSLSVREFGTIYEGLLESELSLARTDLKIDSSGFFVEADGDQSADVRQGEVYFHSLSGSRKSTGSYFTKPFVVEHLLDHSLEPAIDEHLARTQELISRGDQAGAARRFFDFRCADLAMGSGHFLTAAVDRIEARFSEFLIENPIPGVTRELDELRAAALRELRDCADEATVEDTALLRRQIARRCVYGVDLNPIAVELARLALWIHTFVPGLPLSFLDHNLVVGNSLTGIATLDEAAGLLEGQTGEASLEAQIESAKPALERLRTVSDATVSDVTEARKAHEDARAAVASANKLMNLLVLHRAKLAGVALISADATVITQFYNDPAIDEAVSELDPLHFPTTFPEVFYREDPGFDCIVGNPPWDKVRFEAQQFWVTRFPGLNRLAAPERDLEIERLRVAYLDLADAEEIERGTRQRLQELYKAAYSLQATHLDLAKLFTERLVHLSSSGGTAGVVLPRAALVLSGWSRIRKELLSKSLVTSAQARNSGGWLFEDVHLSTTIVFLTRQPSTASEVVLWCGVDSVPDLEECEVEGAIKLSSTELEQLSEAVVIPWFNSKRDAGVFGKLRDLPSLSSGDAWISGSSDSSRWDFSRTGQHASFVDTTGAAGSWRVLMARHVVPFGINEERPFQLHVRKPESLVELGRGVVSLDGAPCLSDEHPMIVYRFPSRNDDSRTMIASALPESGFLFSAGYCHGIRHPADTSTPQKLALLGWLNSYTCDWWVRRFADRHVNAAIVNRLPVPLWTEVASGFRARSGAEPSDPLLACP